jgi:hypothetical protein
MQKSTFDSYMEWSKKQISSIVKEINESNGKIGQVLKDDSLIKIVSNLSNSIRYDLISKNETITYNLSSNMEREIGNIFA